MLVGKAAITSVRYNYRSAKDFQTYLVPAPRKEPNSTPATNTGIEAHAARNFQERIWRRAPRPRLQRPPSTPDAAISKRKEVYRNKSYSLHVGTNRLSRFQDLSPQLFRRDEELVSRARKWIRRELQVFDFLSADADVEEGTRRKANNAEFLLEYIIAILKSVDIKGSGGQAYDMLQEFLGPENSKLFLHELQAWLRSPYTQLDDWDRHVQYGRTAFTTLPEHYLPLTTRKETYAISDSGSTIASPLKRKNPPGMYDFYRPDRDMSSLATKRRTFKRYISD